MIADFNDLSALTPGQEVVIPLKAENPLGCTPMAIKWYKSFPTTALGLTRASSS